MNTAASLRQIALQFTAPSPTVADPNDQYKARFLATLTLALLFISATAFLLSLAVEWNTLLQLRAIQIIGTLSIGLVYLISRTRHWATGAMILIAIMALSGFFQYLALRDHVWFVTSFFLAVWLSRIFLPLRNTVLLIIVFTVSNFLLSYVHANHPLLNAGIGSLFIGFTGALIVIFVYHQHVKEQRYLAELLESASTYEQLTTELNTAKRQLQNLFENLDQVIISMDMVSNTLLQISPSCERLYGIPSQAFYDDPSLLFRQVFPDDQARLDNVISWVGKGLAVTEQLRFQRHGEIRWGQVTLKPVVDATDTVVRVDGVIQDVTEKYQAEQALRYATMRFSTLIQTLHAGVLVEDENRRVVLANEQLLSMFGQNQRAEDMIGQTLGPAASDVRLLFENPDQYVNGIEQTRSQKQRLMNERLRLVDGRVFSRDCIPITLDEQFLGILWQYRDITETVIAEERAEQLLTMEILQRQIVAAFLEAPSSDAAIEYALQVMADLFDVARAYVFHFRDNEPLLDNTHEWCAPDVAPQIDNLKGLAFDELVPSFLPALANEGIIQASDIQSLPEDIYAILHPQAVVSVLIVPFYVAQRLQGFIGFDETRRNRTWLPEEITLLRTVCASYARLLERDRIQNELVQARDSALNSVQVKNEFVSNMSHEIRTPMTGVLGMLELLLETELDATQREFAETAHSSGQNLLHILNDILDFSKIEAGKIILELKAFEVRGIVTEVATTLRSQAEKNHVPVDITIDADTPRRVMGDPTRLRQVLFNLVGNAIKFTHDGSVQISVRQVSSTEDRTRLLFEVIDTGIGIPADQLSHIFESFVQADGSTTRKFGGTGLGLAISKHLVTLMGSELDVESTPGQGSRFSFVLTLPVVTRASHDITLPDLTKLHVLVVDSDDTSRYMLAQQLRVWGVQVDEAALASAALTAANYEGFNVVFVRPDHRASGDARVATKELLALGNPNALYLIVDTPPDQQVPVGSNTLSWPVRQSELFNILARHSDITPKEAEVDTVDEEVPPTVNWRVLLVEDNPMNHQLVQRILKPQALMIDVAVNGQEGVELFQQNHYDLILMDMHMPVMDGMQATRAIREQEVQGQHVPIIALTASILTHERERYIQGGVDDILGKPFSITDLRAKVTKWLPQAP